MRAVMVMFDSLNRRMLPPYGCDWTVAPNFQRLAQRSVMFENCYAGSMPCMPARRELHTGRHNFLHRSWGPLEPFDDSVPEILRDNGVHTHLVTDHYHYWEDGGATYHNRYSTYEFFRGQEGDAWKGHVADPTFPDDLKEVKHRLWRQDVINREYMRTPDQHPQTLTFDAGLEFMTTNLEADGWFLQIETFDPHEPFFSYEEHRKRYQHRYDGPKLDWPEYKKVTEDASVVDHVRHEYSALLSFCDDSLGRVLDFFDAHDLWADTMLIVCTDHGFLLGEHGWFGKNVQPWFDETIHTPLFIWDPRAGVSGESRRSLVQTIDLGPTLLEFFGLPSTADMMGSPLRATTESDAPVREGALFGIFGGHVCVTDGRWVYMRASATVDNAPLHEHTLMPTHMASRFPVGRLDGVRHHPGGLATLADAELHPGFSFTKGVPVLRMPATSVLNPWDWGSLLYDLAADPHQDSPLVDDAEELRLATLMRDLLLAHDAPEDQFVRLGLPSVGALDERHLLVARQWSQLQEALLPALPAEAYPATGWSVHTPLADVLAHPAAAEVVHAHVPRLRETVIPQVMGGLSLHQVSTRVVGLIPPRVLTSLQSSLQELEEAR